MLPFPSSLSTFIVPPNRSTYFLTIDIPSPVPAILLFVVFCSRVNASKIFVRYSWLIPIPVSLTLVLTIIYPSSSHGNSSMLTLTEPPDEVYFMALLRMLTNISFTLVVSVSIFSCSTFIVYWSTRFFFFASSPNISNKFCRMSSIRP